jgi:N-acetylglucosaminyldiphosphoundecaprenol N-acetyl-beta-D-mannosaminyltransferase
LDSIRKVEVYGLPVWHVTVDQLCDLISRWSEGGEGHWIATLNLDYLARCRRDKSFHELLSKADVFTADGMPVLWACRQMDTSFQGLDRTTGADLTPKLLKLADSSRVAIVGGVDPKAALQKLNLDPEGYFIFDGQVKLDADWAKELAAQIGSRSIVFVALGCPKQEKMIALLQPHLPHAVFVAVGGSFEMIAGITTRAPQWMQKGGLEWLYRLAIEPKRLWRRYLLEYPPGAMALYRSIKDARRASSSKLPPS